MYTFTAICRRIKIWWNTPCYYSIVNGMPPVYESEEELQDPRGLVPVSYYTLKQWNFYLWGNDFLKSHPRIIIGIDFAM